MNLDESFGLFIKTERQVLGLTQAELARRVGCATITLRKIEADAMRPSVQILERLAMALDIPLEERAAFVRRARRAVLGTPEPPPTPTPTLSADEIGSEDLTGRAVHGFELADRIGEGGFGAVYRAVQPSVNREVAIKIILPRYANNADFIRRFESEAQLVARLEHPFIVPLYDYWREPDAAFLIMRLMRGGSLKDLLKDGALPMDRVVLVIDQICQALHAAHRYGVIHRDLKPANILLDEDENAYLADFGIAKNFGDPDMDGHTKTGSLLGSFAYLSPEQIRSEPILPQADIYAMGVLIYQLLTGELPFAGPTPIDYIQQHLHSTIPSLRERVPDIPEGLETVIRRATAKEIADRYADVRSLQADVRRALEGYEVVYDLAFLDEAQVDPGAIENPFKGLRAFKEADAEDFFGRDTLIQELLGKLGEEGDLARFLAVVGPSGSGKSSAVRAGLIPALRIGALQDSDKWFIVDVMPGTNPYEELEAALLRVAVNPPESLLSQLLDSPRGILRAVRRVLPRETEVELVLVIDQFEELFTLVTDRELRNRFMNSLLTAVMDPDSRLRVVITLRADFMDRPLEYVDFSELMRERTIFVMPLTPDELEESVIGPARRVGLLPDSGLASRIVRELGDQPGMLPLLQHTLSELFERRQGRRLTLTAYEEIGGVLGSLGRSAENVYQSLDREYKEFSRQLFLRLVTLGEGVEDTRRRVLRSELEALGPAADAVIAAFGKVRLLAFDRDPGSRAPTVEVAHEALLREWPRLRSWMDESRADVRLQRVLGQAAGDWIAHGQDESFLLRGARLDQYASWNESRSVALTSEEAEFLEASLAARSARARAEAERQAREAALEARSRKFLRGLVAVLTTAAAVAIGLSIFAFGQRRLAQDNAAAALAEANGRATQQAIAEDEADSRTAAEQQAVEERDRAVAAEQEARRQASIGLAALAEQEIGGVDLELSVLLALEAVEQYPLTPQAFAALARAVEEFRDVRILETSEAVFNIKNVATWSPDGTRIAAASSPFPDSVFVWDAGTDREILSVNPFEEICPESEILVYDLAWSPNGERLAVIGQDLKTLESCGLFVLDSGSGETLRYIDTGESAARSLDWSPDGRILLSAHEDGILRLWNADEGIEFLRMEGHAGVVRDAVFSPDGRLIASASEDGTIRLWDAASGLAQRVLSVHTGFVRSVDWSPDGSRLVSGGDDALPRVWEVETGETLFVLPGHTEAVVIVTWSADGLRLASQGFDARVKVWDAATGGFLYEISNAAPDTNTKRGFVEFSPDGNWLLAPGSRVLGVHVWDARVSTPILFGHSFGQEWGAWSPDGSLIATSGTDGSARLWDAQTGQQIGDFDQGSYWSDWAPDGTRLVFAEGILANALDVWDVATGEMLSKLFVEDDEFGPHSFLSMDWSPDGAMIAGGDFRPGRSGGIYLWDAATGDLRTKFLTEDLCQQAWPRFSPDSTRIAAGCIFVESGINSPARIWDVATGELIMTLESDYGWTYRAIWSPDGTRIMTVHERGAAIIWDLETGQPLLIFTEHRGVVGAEWSPDGALVASSDFESQQIKIWDAATGDVIMDFSVPGAPLTVSWHPDGTHVIVTGDGFNEPIIKRIWSSTDELVAYAYDCCVTRELTPEEKAQFGLPAAEK